MEGKQGFLRGMDQDSANNKRDPNSYFSMRNFKVLTNEGASSGSLETEKGTSLAFKIPNLASMTLTDGTVIPAQDNLKIIGSTTMVDELILFTTNETSASPNGYGQIWKCKYDEATDSIIGLVGGELTTSHLFYNQKLNFSTEYRIGRAIALYETTKKQRVYWTDNYNQVRVFNLAEANPLDVPLFTVDLFPGTSLVQPTVKSIGSGSLTSGTQIEFTYKLIKSNGGETAYAPPSIMYPLPQETVGAYNFNVFQGGGTNANKSVTYTLTGLDTDYDVIQHIAVVYNTNGTLANIWQYAEESIPASGNLEVLCSSLSGATSISLEEYAVVNTGFDKCKDIEVQGNRLVAANIGTNQFDAEFDTRAYRFNSPSGQYLPVSPAYPLSNSPIAPTTLLQDANTNTDDIVLYGGANVPAWDTVPEEHDCINIYNEETNNNWFHPEQQYKYQKDGVTLGGSGKNISYTFTQQQVTGHAFTGAVPTVAPNHISTLGFPLGTTPIYSGTLEKDGSLKPINIEGQLDSMAAPWAHANFSGYARGETYRFGLVLHDLKGIVGFVDWIGDIKFPDVRDGFPLSEHTGTETSSGRVFVNQLGIEFTVDVSSIADKISGYSIVRLDRPVEDKSKLGTGFHMFFDAHKPSANSSLMHRYYLTGEGGGTGTPNDDPYPVTCQVQLDGDDDEIAWHLSDRPGWNLNSLTNLAFRKHGYLISPLGNIDSSISHKDGDYLETLGYYTSELTHYLSNPAGSGTGGNDAAFGFYYKLSQNSLEYPPTERYQVNSTAIMAPGEYLSGTHPIMKDVHDGTTAIAGGPVSSTVPGVMNSSYTRDQLAFTYGDNELHPLGIGNRKLFFNLNTNTGFDTSPIVPTPTIPHMQTDITYSGGQFWYGPSVGHTFDFNSGDVADAVVVFKSVAYRRYLANQYQGNTYESRSTNQYQYIGHYQITKDLPAANNLTTKVFGGDTYVNYYDSEQIESYVADSMNTQGKYKPFHTNRLSVAVCGPAESSVNTNWRTGNIWGKDRVEAATYAQNSNSIYAGWMGEDIVQEKYFAEDFLSQFVTQHPNQLWASDVKINGELTDSWRSFPIANKTEVDGIYGGINRILSHKDDLMYYQDRAFGVAALDERSVIQDDSGQELVLGTGGVFPDYRYISTHTGTVHQFSVVDSENAVYHYDARLKKFMQYTGGVNPVSDLKGMSSYFAKEMTGAITNTDKTLRVDNPVGVHGIYDQRFNRVLYTFLKPGEKTGKKETISYNELAQAFESFYDYTPGFYMEYGRRLMSVSPLANNEMYTHNTGPYGKYYDSIDSVSKIHSIISGNGDVTKIWNNIAYNSELYTPTGNDIYDETINVMRFWNNYQDTGSIPLVVGNNIKRRMRTWRAIIPREKDKSLSRLRNPWMEYEFQYNNDSGKRHVLHELIYSFTPSNM